MTENNFDMPKDNLGLSVIAAVVAALIGGTIWATIAIMANYEVAVIAWAIGGMAGYAVAVPSKDNITVVHKFIAVLASLFGIALGKYIYFSNQAYAGLGNLFDVNAIARFFRNADIYFGGMDIVFALLAVATAWQIPSQFNKPDETELTEDMINEEIRQEEQPSDHPAEK